ncbi:MAG TPA: transporter substrate-binding domain-containing protein [Stellaceae bacterium]|nr:transporter substrate-binding domain-containing protein [Stellaceae bacterium]
MNPFFRHLAIASGVALGAVAIAAPRSDAAGAAAPLRVCADPDYMPFSNQAGEGFENQVAAFVAKALGRPLEYHWASYRGHGGFSNFLADNLDARKCDAVMDLPYGDVEESYTQPYYISSYVFVTKKGTQLSSLRSPELRTMKIGFEEDTPPEEALKFLGLTDNVVPFHIADNPNASPKSMLQAVEDGKIGVMITWEPAIGYFLKDYPDLTIAQVPGFQQGPGLPAERFTFAMAMGVREHDTALKDALDSVIKAHKAQLDAILARYNVKLYPTLGGGFGNP